jgi:hypothetical protein
MDDPERDDRDSDEEGNHEEQALDQVESHGFSRKKVSSIIISAKRKERQENSLDSGNRNQESGFRKRELKTAENS